MPSQALADIEAEHGLPYVSGKEEECLSVKLGRNYGRYNVESRE